MCLVLTKGNNIMTDSTKKILMIVGGVLLAIFVITGSIVGYVFSVNNQANSFEKALSAERDNNRNILSNYGKKVSEAAQIPDMQRDDFIKVVSAQMQGRYGSDGSKASFQWIKEHNIALDSSVYTKLQQIIEAGRNEFRNGQTKMISVKQGYETVLGSAPRGMFMGMMGYPKVNLKDFDIVSDDRTEKAFSTHKEEAIRIR